MATRVRDIRGEKNPNVELSEYEVREIRADYAEGKRSMRELAFTFTVSLGTIHNIISRKTWSHI